MNERTPMIKRLAKCIREYKTPTNLTLIFIIGEAIIEALIPFITADLVNQIKAGAEMSLILQRGGILTVLAIISLVCGAMAGDLQAVPLLVGLGVTELAVGANAIAQVKALVRTLDKSRCAEAAARACELESAQQVRALVKKEFGI